MMSMFSSELVTGAVAQLQLQMHIASPVTNDITNMQLQSQMRISRYMRVSPVTISDPGHMLTLVPKIAPGASPMMS